MNFMIRRMTDKDLEAVLDLEQKIFSDPWSRESFLFELRQADYSHPLVVESEKQVIVAYAVVWIYAMELHIANFAVHPVYRRKGIGTLLLKHILSNHNQAEFAYLEVRKSNLAAINLYKKFGFQEAGIRKQYYRNGEDALLMVKDLRKSYK